MQEATNMATETQTGMDRAEMKRYLTRSKQEPVNCAIAVGDDKSMALLLLSPSRSSKTLQGELQKQFPSAFNTRIGTAVVDTDDDPTLVKFMLNKAVTSMARRLVKTLKGTGFRKVQILLEDGSPVETAAEEDAAPATPVAEADGVPSAPPPPRAEAKPDPAALAQALTELVRRIPGVGDPAQKEAFAKQAREANVNIKTGNLVYAAAGIESLRRAMDRMPAASGSADAVAQQAASPPPPPPPPPPEAAAKPDPAVLAQALTGMVRRIATITDPAAKEAMAKQAREASVNIKTGNLAYAATGIEALRRALDAAPASAASDRGSADFPKADFPKLWADAVGAWRKASETTDVQIAALQRRLRASGDNELKEIAEYGLNGVTGGFKVKLLAMLQESAGGAPNASQAARALPIVNGFRAHIARDQRVQACDENPWNVPMSLRSTLGGALTQLDAALRMAPGNQPA
jgi:hypothetical protein